MKTAKFWVILRGKLGNKSSFFVFFKAKSGSFFCFFYKKKKTLWMGFNIVCTTPLAKKRGFVFLRGGQILQSILCLTVSKIQSHFEETVYLLALSHKARLSWHWNHPVVWNWAPLDWESSTITSRPLLLSKVNSNFAGVKMISSIFFQSLRT